MVAVREEWQRLVKRTTARTDEDNHSAKSASEMMARANLWQISEMKSTMPQSVQCTFGRLDTNNLPDDNTPNYTSTKRY